MTPPRCDWTECGEPATKDVLVTRGDGTHFVVGPYCAGHAAHYSGQGSHVIAGSGEVVHYELLEIVP